VLEVDDPPDRAVHLDMAAVLELVRRDHGAEGSVPTMPEGLTDAQIIERIQRLERNLTLIAKHVGVDLDDPAANVSNEVAELARAGDRMAAAKLHAEQTGTDFVEAQRIVNAI
jgi:hypothetical protein